MLGPAKLTNYSTKEEVTRTFLEALAHPSALTAKLSKEHSRNEFSLWLWQTNKETFPSHTGSTIESDAPFPSGPSALRRLVGLVTSGYARASQTGRLPPAALRGFVTA